MFGNTAQLLECLFLAASLVIPDYRTAGGLVIDDSFCFNKLFHRSLSKKS